MIATCKQAHVTRSKQASGNGPRCWTLVEVQMAGVRSLTIDLHFPLPSTLNRSTVALFFTASSYTTHNHEHRTYRHPTRPSYQPLTSNQKASVAYGWGVLILAGGGAYYFAKRSINADREERAAMNERRRQAMRPQRPAPTSQISANQDRPSPSQEGGADPAPVTHAQEDLSARGKYEAAEPFRSRKGDRFS